MSVDPTELPRDAANTPEHEEAKASWTIRTRPDPFDDDPDAVAPAGKFRIYLGAAAGVGKTFAMLGEGHRRLSRGTDVVAAYVETHARPATQDLVKGLEVIPRMVVDYRGSRFEEMDLTAVLERHPKVALVDELAHTNVPSPGRNEKRWQDVMVLLDAGIDVVSTVNIQHLESIADAVEQITGVEVRERVPDWVVRRADQIELVDSSPEQLRRRMLHGNIYPPQKITQALQNFFKTDNLIALRELALRFLADETEEEMLDHLQRHHAKAVWETAERIMVAVTAAPGTDQIIRRAARLAARFKAPLHVVHVADADTVPVRDLLTLEALTKVASNVGAIWSEIPSTEPAAALIKFAQDNQVTQLVIGSSQRTRWQEMTKGGSIVRKVMKQAGEQGIDVHIIARRHPYDIPERGD